LKVEKRGQGFVVFQPK